jgi:radial spoke head protein 1
MFFVQNGSRYIGNYCRNKKQGSGVFHYPDGSSFDGEWLDDRRTGNGTFNYSNGDIYDGQWQDNMKHGKGTYTFAENQSKYIGQWVKGKAEGAGELLHSNHRYQVMRSILYTVYIYGGPFYK